jgi:hypothetical protein
MRAIDEFLSAELCFTEFYQHNRQAILRFSIRESHQWGCPVQTNARDRRISFRRLCFTEFYQHNPSDFCTVLFRP